jgi:hypothetical protein
VAGAERIAYVFAQKSPSTPRRFPVDIVAAATARAVRTDDAMIGRFIQVYECSYDARAALADHSSGPERFWRNARPTAGALTLCSAIERAFAKILSQRADIRIGAPLNPPCERLSVRLDAQTLSKEE